MIDKINEYKTYIEVIIIGLLSQTTFHFLDHTTGSQSTAAIAATPIFSLVDLICRVAVAVVTVHTLLQKKPTTKKG